MLANILSTERSVKFMRQSTEGFIDYIAGVAGDELCMYRLTHPDRKAIVRIPMEREAIRKEEQGEIEKKLEEMFYMRVKYSRFFQKFVFRDY